MLADIPSPIQNAVQQPRTIPESLPTQGAVAFVIDACSLKLVAPDLDFRVVEKHFHLPAMQPTRWFGLLAGPVDKLRVEPMERSHTLRALGPEKFSQGGLVGPLGQSQQLHQHPVFAHPLGIGQ